MVAAYALSFVDRQVIGLLVQPLKADLHLSDTQIGILQGPAFVVFYALLGMPLGWLADRVRRTWLIAVGLLLWSLMTAASGLAGSFPALLACRLGVGVGEAALAPAAISLMADLFEPHRRALPMSTFTAGVALGAGLALVLGGSFIAYAAHGVGGLPLLGPWLATRHPWQVVFILAGLTGVPLALMIVLLREPPRQAYDDGVEPTLRLWAHLARRMDVYGPMLGAAALLYLFSNALSAWAPSLFVRGFHWTPAQVGVRLGLVVMGCALAGNLAAGLSARAMAARGRRDAALMSMVIGACVLVPAASLGPLVPSAAFALAAMAAPYFGVALCFGTATAAFVGITPGPLRGQVVALYLLVGNLVGLGLGPVSVGFLLDHMMGDPARVGWALALVGAAASVPGALLLAKALKPYAACAAASAAPTITTAISGQSAA
jgi:MFS family permease